VLRVWQLPVAQVLAGGVGTLPLAPISALGKLAPTDVIQRMKERLRQGRHRRLAAEIWAATYVLLGIRFPRDVIHLLLREVLTAISHHRTRPAP
jgi:hypothetical protein